MMDYIMVEYVGPQVGGFSIPAPSGRRYRFNPPYRRVTQVAREDAVFLLSKGGYRIASAPTLGPAVRRSAPVSDPIRVSDFQTGTAPNRAARAAQAATLVATVARVAASQSTPRQTPAQVVEQTVERGREMAPSVNAPATQTVSPQREYGERRARVPRVVDDKRMPKWTPNI